MKKIFSIFIPLLLLLLGIQLIVTQFTSSYQIEYSIKNKDNFFYVEEFFDKNNHYNYDFSISDSKGNKYIISLMADLNKQKRVIKDIKYYSDENIMCIFPIFRRDKKGEISCLYNNEQVSVSYLESIGIPLNKLFKTMVAYGYGEKFSNDNLQPKEFVTQNRSKFYIYEDNIYDGYTYAIWNYNGLLLLKKDNIKEKAYYNSDIYDNSNSVLVGKYYYILSFDGGDSIDIDYVNLEDFGKTTITLSQPLSSDLYVNGVYKNKLYVTDIKSKKQFIFDSFNQKANIYSDKFYILIDDKLKSVSKDYFFSKRYYFNDIASAELSKKYGNIKLLEYENYFYFYYDNVFYKVHKNYLNQPIRLLKYNEVRDWKISGGDLIFVNGDTMYLYSDIYGIKPIVKNSEFKFNYNNICNFYKKM